jgi:glutathione S-transferase
MNAPERFTLQMTRFIHAPRDKVFDAFTKAEMLGSWIGTRGTQVDSAQADARAGGSWRVAMHARDGSAFVVAGHFQHLERPARLAYTWQWEGEKSPMPQVQTLIEVELTERDGGTELRMTHSGFPAAAAREGHQQGWASAFNRLNDLLDPRGSAGTITLLGDPRSTYTRTVRMALAEKGVAYTLQTCAPRSPEILAVHPFGRIPALRDGETALWETGAILNYLDECFDTGTPLRPGNILDRTRSLQWISAINAYLYDTMVRRFVLQFIFPRGPGGQPDRAVIAAALEEMAPQFAALEAAYARTPYLAGNSLSAADLLLAPILAYVQHMPEGATLMADYPHVLQSQALVRQRPSFAATQPQ